jgi:putative nucleotidyltransferase with HDIG domain
LNAVNKKKTRSQFLSFFRSRTTQRVLIAIITIAVSVAIVENGAAPKKYRLELGESSKYDISAPRDIENVLLTEKYAKEAAENVTPVMERLDSVSIDIINSLNVLFNDIRSARQSVYTGLSEQGAAAGDNNYQELLLQERAEAADVLALRMKEAGVQLSDEQVMYLVAEAADDELDRFQAMTVELISMVMKKDVTESNLASQVDFVQNTFELSDMSQEFKIIGSVIAATVLRPNSVIDEAETNKARNEAYDAALEDKHIITEGSRIISFGDTVTEDKLEVLRELNLLETGGFDYAFAGGILLVVLMLSFLLILYLHNFCSRIIPGTKETILLCVIILLTLLSAWLLNPVRSLIIPVFIAPMLITILLDLRLGIIVNILLSLTIFFMTRGDMGFLYTAVIGGTTAAFIVTGANQRSRLSASGLVIALINAAVIACVGLINKSGLYTIAVNAALVAVNGMLSTIFTIGVLPFFESTFNIITPLKLLELANPNQPLMKKLLMEAPGTYHHSLMVGNLAEVAAEAINGNALLARVGAYYHDVGKLKRPNFFKENQLSDNPHDRMTPNLSTLVITSHTSDGVEIAERYKVPLAVRNIISQHHGTTLAAYFYYKAKKGDKGENIKQEDFRYQGPRPSTKEAAVVMLADSVEAAVRSMVEKTEGKIEGLIRKIIKDKLDDGQLDLCELTLRDLDLIAKAFMRVFGGYFHERQEYPELKIKRPDEESGREADPLTAEADMEPSVRQIAPVGTGQDNCQNEVLYEKAGKHDEKQQV